MMAQWGLTVGRAETRAAEWCDRLELPCRASPDFTVLRAGRDNRIRERSRADAVHADRNAAQSAVPATALAKQGVFA